MCRQEGEERGLSLPLDAGEEGRESPRGAIRAFAGDVDEVEKGGEGGEGFGGGQGVVECDLLVCDGVGLASGYAKGPDAARCTFELFEEGGGVGGEVFEDEDFGFFDAGGLFDGPSGEDRDAGDGC